MTAYVIADIEVQDLEKYEQYKPMAAKTIDDRGAKYLARGGQTEVLEGDWTPRRLVILEFESLEAAKEWWNSEDYGPAKALRQSASDSRMVVIEGDAPA